MLAGMTGPKPTHRPCAKPKPYKRKSKVPIPKNSIVHRTAAKPSLMKKHKNLTLHDWMTVFAYMDKHPHMSQGDIARHFGSKADGALIFDQSTLS